MCIDGCKLVHGWDVLVGRLGLGMGGCMGRMYWWLGMGVCVSGWDVWVGRYGCGCVGG